MCPRPEGRGRDKNMFFENSIKKKIFLPLIIRFLGTPDVLALVSKYSV